MISGDFEVYVTVGCFGESSIGPDWDLIVPYSEVYDVAIILPYADPYDSTTWVFSTELMNDLFYTEITDCFASILTFCEDENCVNPLASTSVWLETYANDTASLSTVYEYGSLKILTTDKALYQEFFIIGSALDPTVFASVKVIAAVCGDRFTFTGLDEIEVLFTQLTAPDLVSIKSIDLLSLFYFETPSDHFDTD